MLFQLLFEAVNSANQLRIPRLKHIPAVSQGVVVQLQDPQLLTQLLHRIMDVFNLNLCGVPTVGLDHVFGSVKLCLQADDGVR